jgi:hypothetical protein
MKKLLLLAALAALALGSCDQHEGQRLYQLVTREEVLSTDTLTQAKIARFITETTRAASQQMTGGDYEDPEDVIAQAQATAYKLYARPVVMLQVGEGNFQQDLEPAGLNAFDRAAYDSLQHRPFGTSIYR